MQDIFEIVNRLTPDEMVARGILTPARVNKDTYICLECGNGEGKDGDGLTVTQGKNGRYNYKCWGKCGKSFSNSDLIGIKKGVDVNDRAELAKTLREFIGDDFGSVAISNEKNPVKEENKKIPILSREEKDFTEFYKFAQGKLKDFIDSCGGTWRGLTFETLQKFGCGYHSEFDTIKKPFVIIPSNGRLTQTQKKTDKNSTGAAKNRLIWRGLQGLKTAQRLLSRARLTRCQ